VPKNAKSTIPGLVGTWADVFNNIGSVRYQDAILGIVCCIVLLLMRVRDDVGFHDELTAKTN